MLKQEVHTYLRFNDHSGDKPCQAIKHFTAHLINVYEVRLVTLGVNSVFIILDCPTLGSLEHLWSDYLSGHLNKVAERYLVTDKMRKKLNLETICLTTTIAVENYLNCKKALTEHSSTCSGEFKQSVGKYIIIHEVIFEKRVLMFYWGFQTRENCYSFWVFGNPGKTRSTSFWNDFLMGA